MAVTKVGVVGCGLMGSGIAEVCARAGYDTLVSEINHELLNKGLEMLKSSLARGLKAGKLTEAQRDEALGRLRGTTNLAEFADRDLVIEAIVENMAEKKKLYARLDAICPPQSIFASNTSSLTIIEMAAATRRPERVIGLHFFNPAPVMRLVEVVRTISSSDEALETGIKFVESLGKRPILAQDTPGFIVNRLLVPYLINAVRLLEAGLATKEDIDQGMVLGCGHPMGPLTLLDYVGLDTAFSAANAMCEEFKEPFYAPPPLLKRMVLAGRLGRKTGKGFYEY